MFPQRRMVFRIGINLGDVIYDEKRIYGDGVNIAARLKSLAQPGEIFVSEDVYRNVRGRIRPASTTWGSMASEHCASGSRVSTEDCRH